MTSKTAVEVKALFEVPEKYLGPRRYDIRVRVETVQQFTKTLHFDRVLDIGCGDGAISLPLLSRCSITDADATRSFRRACSIVQAAGFQPNEAGDVEVIDGDRDGC